VELGETAAGWSPIHPAFAPREIDGEAETKLLEAKKALADSEVQFHSRPRLDLVYFPLASVSLEKG
jgi:hypothetical protein